MTGTLLALDPSALVHRYVPGPDRSTVNDAMSAADAWAISALGRAELLIALHRLAPDPYTADDLAAQARRDLDAMVVVPVDDRCVARSVELGTRFGLRLSDAVHLAAYDRLPRPLALATLDPAQIPAATALGMEVMAPLADG